MVLAENHLVARVGNLLQLVHGKKGVVAYLRYAIIQTRESKGGQASWEWEKGRCWDWLSLSLLNSVSNHRISSIFASLGLCPPTMSTICKGLKRAQVTWPYSSITIGWLHFGDSELQFSSERIWLIFGLTVVVDLRSSGHRWSTALCLGSGPHIIKINTWSCPFKGDLNGLTHGFQSFHYKKFSVVYVFEISHWVI